MRKQRKAGIGGRPSLWQGPTEIFIKARVPDSHKRAMIREALRVGLSLSEWMRITLMNEVDRQANRRRGRVG